MQLFLSEIWRQPLPCSTRTSRFTFSFTFSNTTPRMQSSRPHHNHHRHLHLILAFFSSRSPWTNTLSTWVNAYLQALWVRCFPQHVCENLPECSYCAGTIPRLAYSPPNLRRTSMSLGLNDDASPSIWLMDIWLSPCKIIRGHVALAQHVTVSEEIVRGFRSSNKLSFHSRQGDAALFSWLKLTGMPLDKTTFPVS